MGKKRFFVAIYRTVRVSPFYIRIKIDRRDIRLKVEQRQLTPIHEEFIVTARNGQLVFKSNRPLLRGKGIKKRDPDFTMLEGNLKHASYERAIIKAIITHLEKIEKDHIPITFEYRGKIFSGHLGRVAGAGNNSVWHLNGDGGRYFGRLRKSIDDEWVFDGSAAQYELQYLARFFGNHITERT